MTSPSKPSRVRIIATFQIDVEMPQGMKQKEWEQQITENIKSPGGFPARPLEIVGKPRLIEKKVRYE